MKKIIILVFLALALAFVTTPVLADSYGSVDVITEYALLTNSGNAEDEWLASKGFVEVEEYLGVTISWTNIGGTIWAAQLKDSPEYYFMKIGIGGTTILYDHFIYQNNTALTWAVIDLKDWYIGTSVPDLLPDNVNVGRISHVGESTPVPEPATLFLLGLGLVGVAGIRRKIR
jgi:hypothetical protein